MVAKRTLNHLAVIAAISMAVAIPTKASAWWEWDLSEYYTYGHKVVPRCTCEPAYYPTPNGWAQWPWHRKYHRWHDARLR